MPEKKTIFLDGFAVMVGGSPFKKIASQPPPTDPRIKHLLGRALTNPGNMTPEEVREMAASVVYHLLAIKEGVRS